MPRLLTSPLSPRRPGGNACSELTVARVHIQPAERAAAPAAAHAATRATHGHGLRPRSDYRFGLEAAASDRFRRSALLARLPASHDRVYPLPAIPLRAHPYGEKLSKCRMLASSAPMQTVKVGTRAAIQLGICACAVAGGLACKGCASRCKSAVQCVFDQEGAVSVSAGPKVRSFSQPEPSRNPRRGLRSALGSGPGPGFALTRRVGSSVLRHHAAGRPQARTRFRP